MNIEKFTPKEDTKDTNSTHTHHTVHTMTETGQIQKFKLVIVGEQSVGKTSLITRIMYDKFDQNYEATIGIQFLSKPMYLPDRTIRLQLWDTAGQERFRSLVPAYIRDSHIAIVVYAIDSRKSFVDVDKWIEDVKAERGNQVVLMLVGNKSDLEESREVTTEEGQEKAKQYDALFLETSAKAGHNVKSILNKVASELPGLETALKTDQSELIDVNITNEPEQDSCSC